MTTLEIYTLFILPCLILAMAGAGYLWITRQTDEQPHGTRTKR
jgi:hypothetical protein